MFKFLAMIKEFRAIFIIFTLFISIFFLFLVYNKNKQIDDYLVILQNSYDVQYKITYENLKKLSQNTFYGIINKPDIFNNIKTINDESRVKLYESFISDYNRLLEYNFNQIHFHTKNNISFLRMHKSDVFGDDLSTIRKSVVETNKELRPIEGFEIGRFINGFRFVYPIFDENLFHIGSVEVSASSEAFELNYEKDFVSDLHFLLRKDIAKEKMYDEPFNQLLTSFENEDYIFNENGKNELYHFKNENLYSKKDRNHIKKMMSDGNSFIMYKNNSNNHTTIYYKAITNILGINNVAYLVIYTNSEYLKLLSKNYTIANMLILLIIIIFLFLMHSKYEEINKIKQQEKIFNQQSKLATMGELINNISHQWRQPLSVISTSASGVKIQHEFGILDDESLEKSMSVIVEQSELLSKTIEDFRNLNTNDKKKSPFDLENIINNSIMIFNEDINKNHIKLIKNIENCELISYPDELKQILVILIKNAIDAIIKDGIIIISSTIKGKNIIIKVQDSGGGIPKDKLSKIFEPYFTTKHKSQGTGIALYSAHELIKNSFNGLLKATNQEFTYKLVRYKGALFTITLNKEEL